MACMILAESCLFAVFVAAYLFYIGKSLIGPYPQDVLDVPVLATIALLSSSISITLAVRALRRGAHGLFAVWWAVTIALGAFFLVATFVEWKGLIYDHNLTIWTNLFGTTYFSLVGFHAGHVTVGLLLLGLVLLLALRGAVRRRTPSASRSCPGTGTSSTSCGSWCSPSCTWWDDERARSRSHRAAGADGVADGRGVGASRSPSPARHASAGVDGRRGARDRRGGRLVPRGAAGRARRARAAGAARAARPAGAAGRPAPWPARAGRRRAPPAPSGRVPSVFVRHRRRPGRRRRDGGDRVRVRRHRVRSLWYPINLLAAVAIPSLATADTAQLAAFNGLAFGVAAISHVAISIFVGLVYAAILPMFPRRPAVSGGVIAPLLWSGLLWASLGVINPTLNGRIDWPWFVASQIAFGIAAGVVITRTQRIRTMQSLPFAARAGIEAPGLSEEKDRE
jgi:cytochrome c oxidase subunit 3/cytochrome o ubiquinol oxidase subunit 3